MYCVTRPNSKCHICNTKPNLNHWFVLMKNLRYSLLPLLIYAYIRFQPDRTEVTVRNTSTRCLFDWRELLLIWNLQCHLITAQNLRTLFSSHEEKFSELLRSPIALQEHINNTGIVACFCWICHFMSNPYDIMMFVCGLGRRKNWKIGWTHSQI